MAPVMLVLSGEAGPDNSGSITKFNISAVISVQAHSGDGNAAQLARISPVLIFRVTTREHATVRVHHALSCSLVGAFSGSLGFGRNYRACRAYSRPL